MGRWMIRSARDADRWVRWDGAAWTADPVTAARLDALAPGGPFGPALTTPVGPWYTPTSDADETALFINACGALPGGATLVEGALPADTPPPSLPDGAVS